MRSGWVWVGLLPLDTRPRGSSPRSQHGATSAPTPPSVPDPWMSVAKATTTGSSCLPTSGTRTPRACGLWAWRTRVPTLIRVRAARRLGTLEPPGYPTAKGLPAVSPRARAGVSGAEYVPAYQTQSMTGAQRVLSPAPSGSGTPTRRAAGERGPEGQEQAANSLSPSSPGPPQPLPRDAVPLHAAALRDGRGHDGAAPGPPGDQQRVCAAGHRGAVPG